MDVTLGGWSDSTCSIDLQASWTTISQRGGALQQPNRCRLLRSTSSFACSTPAIWHPLKLDDTDDRGRPRKTSRRRRSSAVSNESMPRVCEQLDPIQIEHVAPTLRSACLPRPSDHRTAALSRVPDPRSRQRASSPWRKVMRAR